MFEINRPSTCMSRPRGALPFPGNGNQATQNQIRAFPMLALLNCVLLNSTKYKKVNIVPLIKEAKKKVGHRKSLSTCGMWLASCYRLVDCEDMKMKKLPRSAKTASCIFSSSSNASFSRGAPKTEISSGKSPVLKFVMCISMKNSFVALFTEGQPDDFLHCTRQHQTHA